MLHPPPPQLGVPWVALQGMLQPPQFCTSAVMLVSQPAVLSQSAKPALHENVQLPLVHAGVAFGAGGQTLPQLPQLVSEPVVAVSQPLAGFVSQSPKPGLQLV